MLGSTAQMHDWIGRTAMDPYGEQLGEIASILADSEESPFGTPPGLAEFAPES